MRTLTLIAAGVVASVFLAASAQAVSLIQTADKSTYNVGETITLTIVGDPMGVADFATTAYATYDSVLTTVTSQSQTQLVSFGGFVPWIMGVLFVDIPPGTMTAWDQIGGLSPIPPSNMVTSIITLTADAAGVANFGWLTTTANKLRFFGLTNAPGTSVTIVPEPTTAALLGIGLLGLAVAGRRR